jgi:hypothetical protein
VSFGPEPGPAGPGGGRWSPDRWGSGGGRGGPGRWSPGGARRDGQRRQGGRPAVLATVLATVALLGGLGTALGLFVAHQDDTIRSLRTALQAARHPAAAAAPVLPVESGSALFTVPDSTGGALSVVAAAVRPQPRSAALTWLYIYDNRAVPGARYGVLEGICGGQFVTSSDLADGIANRAGDLTIVAPNLTISATAADVWILVYRWDDGLTLGGVQGPLIGPGARTFRSVPPC